MADESNNFFGLPVPEGTDRRELYKSQYRAIHTYKMNAQELDEKFRSAITEQQLPNGPWTIKNDDRIKYVGKLDVVDSKGEATIKVTSRPSQPTPAHSPQPLCARRFPRHPHARSLLSPLTQVAFEDYPEAGMSALKYYTVQSYTK